LTLLERIKRHSSRLTEADQRLVSALLDDTAEAAFLSSAGLAQRANVHEAATTRLAQKLGFKGYPELRTQLQRELVESHDAADRMRRSVARVEHGDFLPDLIGSEIAALESLSRSVSQDSVDRAADLIAGASRIFLFGQGHAQSITQFLRRRLDRFGMTSVLLEGRGRDIAERVVSLGEDDVVLALAFRKQPTSYAPLIEHARAQRARTILVTDLAGSLMQPAADLVMAAPRGRSGSEFQTPTVPFAIVNAILLTIAGRHQARVMRPLELLSKLFDAFD
jgi:DNA-binding MurR/RpiR family transcriptional regulator